LRHFLSAQYPGAGGMAGVSIPYWKYWTVVIHSSNQKLCMGAKGCPLLLEKSFDRLPEKLAIH
jgi:hypothetical protein